MNNSPIEQKSREAWRKYNGNNQAKFWQYYEHLLANARQTQARKQVKVMYTPPTLPKEKLYAPRSTKAHKPKSSKVKVLAMTFGLLILFALTFIIDPSSNRTYVYTEEIQEQDAMQAQKRLEWLQARLNTQDKTALNEWLALQSHITPDDEAVREYIKYKQLIDWSKTPINLYPEDEEVYALFTPKDTVVYFVMHNEVSVHKILPHQKQYTIVNTNGQQETFSIKSENRYKASLKLKYAEVIAEIDQNGVVYFTEEGKRFDVIKQDYPHLETVLKVAPTTSN